MSQLLCILFWLLALVSLSYLKQTAHSVGNETYIRLKDYRKWIQSQSFRINRSNFHLLE